MKKYDVTVLVKTGMSQEAKDGFVGKMEKTVKAMGGTVGKFTEMGSKQIAYKVNNVSEAEFLSWMVELPSSGVVELKKKLTVDREILRHLIVAAH